MERMETEVEVRFYGGIAVATGTDKARVSFKGGTLAGLLAEITRRWPKAGELIGGNDGGSVVLILNGRALEPPDPGIVIAQGDVISIMPFVAGG